MGVRLLMKSKTNSVLFTIIFVLLIFAIIVGFVIALRPDYPDVEQWYSYKVRSGDTLWDIVPHKDGYDIRDLIQVVREYNELTSSGLEEGDVIELPVWKEN